MNGQEYTQSNEGCRLEAYQDSVKGVWTIGYGCTGPAIGPGVVWTQAQADNEFNRRYAIAQSEALAALGVLTYSDAVRLAVLTDMAYQMGGNGLAEFRYMLTAIRAEEWPAAQDACLDSLYAKQTPERAERNGNMLLTGEWPDNG